MLQSAPCEDVSFIFASDFCIPIFLVGCPDTLPVQGGASFTRCKRLICFPPRVCLLNRRISRREVGRDLVISHCRIYQLRLVVTLRDYFSTSRSSLRSPELDRSKLKPLPPNRVLLHGTSTHHPAARLLNRLPRRDLGRRKGSSCIGLQ